MIKIDITSTKAGEGYNVDSDIHIEGKGDAIIGELTTLLNNLDKSAHELLNEALEQFLLERGF